MAHVKGPKPDCCWVCDEKFTYGRSSGDPLSSCTWSDYGFVITHSGGPCDEVMRRHERTPDGRRLTPKAEFRRLTRGALTTVRH